MTLKDCFWRAIFLASLIYTTIAGLAGRGRARSAEPRDISRKQSKRRTQSVDRSRHSDRQSTSASRGRERIRSSSQTRGGSRDETRGGEDVRVKTRSKTRTRDPTFYRDNMYSDDLYVPSVSRAASYDDVQVWTGDDAYGFKQYTQRALVPADSAGTSGARRSRTRARARFPDEDVAEQMPSRRRQKTGQEDVDLGEGLTKRTYFLPGGGTYEEIIKTEVEKVSGKKTSSSRRQRQPQSRSSRGDYRDARTTGRERKSEHYVQIGQQVQKVYSYRPKSRAPSSRTTREVTRGQSIYVPYEKPTAALLPYQPRPRFVEVPAPVPETFAARSIYGFDPSQGLGALPQRLGAAAQGYGGLPQGLGATASGFGAAAQGYGVVSTSAQPLGGPIPVGDGALGRKLPLSLVPVSRIRTRQVPEPPQARIVTTQIEGQKAFMSLQEILLKVPGSFQTSDGAYIPILDQSGQWITDPATNRPVARKVVEYTDPLYEYKTYVVQDSELHPDVPRKSMTSGQLRAMQKKQNQLQIPGSFTPAPYSLRDAVYKREGGRPSQAETSLLPLHTPQQRVSVLEVELNPGETLGNIHRILPQRGERVYEPQGHVEIELSHSEFDIFHGMRDPSQPQGRPLDQPLPQPLPTGRFSDYGSDLSSRRRLEPFSFLNVPTTEGATAGLQGLNLGARTDPTPPGPLGLFEEPVMAMSTGRRLGVLDHSLPPSYRFSAGAGEQLLASRSTASRVGGSHHSIPPGSRLGGPGGPGGPGEQLLASRSTASRVGGSDHSLPPSYRFSAGAGAQPVAGRSTVLGGSDHSLPPSFRLGGPGVQQLVTRSTAAILGERDDSLPFSSSGPRGFDLSLALDSQPSSPLGGTGSTPPRNQLRNQEEEEEGFSDLE